MIRLVSFSSRDALMCATGDRIEAALRAGLAARGRACAALSGGSTPEPAYIALSARALDWPRIAFALVDERFVPPSEPASNEGMLRRALAPALAAGAGLEPLYSPQASAAAAAATADRRYALLDLDLALMGMGADGHTASWFPGHAQEALESDRMVVAVQAPGAAGSSARLTITRAALLRARQVVVLITGEEKRQRLESAMTDDVARAPIRALFEGRADPPEILWAA